MTKNPRFAVIVLGFAILCPAFVPTAKADMWNKKTILTFSGPVRVSNTTLPAGTYVFKLADSPANRHIVQIFNQDETHIYATILAMPASRLEPADDTVIKFAETASSGDMNSGTLPADGVPIKKWFYPGDQFGQEFVIRPASLTTTAAAVETPASPEPTPAVEPTPSAQAPAETAEAQPAPSPEPEAQAQPAPQTEQQPSAPAEQPTPTSLPKTASSMPLIGLVGLLSLGMAAGLGLVANRRTYR